MTPEQKRIAIAEACGWEFKRTEADAETCWRLKDLYGSLPDYLNDLNAMHEAEKKIPITLRDKWWQHLYGICDKEHRMASVGGWLAPTATAAQRAEAFLRTLGLWKEDK